MLPELLSNKGVGLKHVQRDTEDQGRQEKRQKMANVMMQCDNQIEELEKDIQCQQFLIEQYKKAIQNGVQQELHLRDAELQDENDHVDLEHLEEQHESLLQQLKVAQVELVQQGKKSLEEGDAKFYDPGRAEW